MNYYNCQLFILMMNQSYSISKLNQNLIATFMMSILSAIAIVSGVVPELSLQTGELSFSNRVLAQNVTDDELKKYGQAFLEIEKLRQTTLTNIENIVGKEKTAQMACNQDNTINQLPENARNIANNYCTQSEAIVKKYGLSITQFNQITKTIQQNPSLKQQLVEMIKQM